MNKARFILFILGIGAFTAGALSFKAMRSGSPVITTTTAVNANFTRYTLAGAAQFCWTRSDMFFTDDQQANLGLNLLTTTNSPTAKLTLTRIGGTETITIPNFCTVTAMIATTRITNID